MTDRPGLIDIPVQHPTWMRMQPTFRLRLRNRADELVDAMKLELRSAAHVGRVVSAGASFDFRVPEKESRFWSPHLAVQVLEANEGCEVFGRFSPRPEIWTMFMAIYAIVAGWVFLALMFGYAQWHMGQAPWAFVLVPVGIGVIVGLHLASLVGQRWSVDQMHELSNRLESALKACMDQGKQSKVNEVRCDVSRE
ncbi:MAG: hypothetical protein AAGD07_25895 [Planctomycetota bacterium]